MAYRIVWVMAAALFSATAAPAAAPLGTVGLDTPQAANASRTPEKRAEKQPKQRKSKKATRSGSAASAAS